MLSRKQTLISLGGILFMVLLGTFLRSKQAPSVTKNLVEKAEHFVRSIHKKAVPQGQTMAKNSVPSEQSAADVEATNPFSDWDKERLEKELVDQNAVEKLNRQDLAADERQELMHLLIALQDAREAWVKDQVQKIEAGVAQAESDQQQKLAETREKLEGARQVP